MATHDYVIANGTGAAVRSDLNNALAAIVSNNSSATEPTTTYAYMWWADTTAGQLKLRNAADNAWVTIQELDGTMLIEDGTAGAPGLAFASDLDTGFFSAGANALGIATNGTERMRIDSAGDVFGAGKTDTSVASGSEGWALTDAGTHGRYISYSSSGAGTTYPIFFYHSGASPGNISTTSTATSYNSASDYRLKENVVPLTNAANRLNQLQVHRFNFIADPDNTVDGFLAHEAQAVVPECVTGDKDAIDDEGNPVYQGIDQSKLVPLLTAALQEALAKIETLEQRLSDAGIA